MLVCDERREDSDFNYWLPVVELLSDGSTVLIVQNEKQDRSCDINLSGLRAQYGNLKEVYAEIRRQFDGIADTLRDMNALTAEDHQSSGFDELIRKVRVRLGV